MFWKQQKVYLFLKDSSQSRGAVGKNIFANSCFCLQSEKCNCLERCKCNWVAPTPWGAGEVEDPGLDNHSLPNFLSEVIMRLRLPHKQVLVRVACICMAQDWLFHVVSEHSTACFAQHSAFHHGKSIMRQILLTETLYLVKTKESEY